MSKSWVAASIGLSCALLLPLYACYLEPKEERQSISVARVALPVVALTHVAEAQGYFADEKLDVTFADYTTGREALDDVCAGKYDLAIAFTTPVVHDTVMGKDLVILTELHQSQRNTALVALAGHGIDKPEDLVGKTVGVTMGTSGEFFLDVLLIDNGLDPSSVERKPISIVDAEKVMKQGDVDAVVAWNPYLYQIRNQWPPAELRVFTSEVYVEMSLLVGLRNTVDEKSQAIARFLRALARAQEFFAGHSNEARLAASRQAKGPARIDANSPMWDDLTLGLGLNHVMLLTLDQEAGWMRSKGLTKGELTDFRSHIEDNLLRRIAPDFVTLPLSDNLRPIPEAALRDVRVP